MSFLDTVLQAAPTGSNPYAFAIEFIAARHKPAWYFHNLIAVGIIAMVNLLSTIVSIIVFWRRSRAGSSTCFWFFRMQHGHSSGIPYLTPNALTMFLLWNLIFMSLMQPYIWLNYAAYYSLNSRIMSRMYFWYGFIFIWDGVGMWWSAFGTLYATLLPRLFTLASSHLLANILLHPLTLNAFCFAPPTILMITQLVTSTFSAIAWSNLVHTRSYLLDSLATLATQWNARDHQKLDETLVQRAVAVGTPFLKRKELSLVAFQRNMGACAIWYLLCTILFTPTALWLLSIIRGSLNQEMRRMNTCVCRTAVTWGSSSPPFHLHWNPVRQSNPPAVSNNLRHQGEPDQIQWSSDAGANYRDSQNESMRSLRRAFFTVGLQFFATFFCMSAAAGGWLWMTIDAGRMIVRPELHSFAIILSMWVFATAGCLINLFILIRVGRPRQDSQERAQGVLRASSIRFAPSSRSWSDVISSPDQSRGRVFVKKMLVTDAAATRPSLGPTYHLGVECMRSPELAEQVVFEHVGEADQTGGETV